MKLLWISEYFPFPPHDGNALPIYHFIRQLAPQARITLLTHQPALPERLSLAKRECAEWGVELQTTSNPPRARAVRAMDCLRAGIWWPNRFYSSAMAAAARQQLATTSYDLVLSEGILSAQHLPRGSTLPQVLIARDCLSLAHQRRWKVTGDPRQWLQARKIAAMERALYRHAAIVYAISPVDLGAMRRLSPKTRFELLPNGVDVDYLQPLPRAVEPFSVLFSGDLAAPPNADAALWLVNEIWPLVKARQPAARLVIAGRNPQPALVTAASQAGPSLNIEITGPVPEMLPYLQRAAVIVSPLRFGTGVKNKVLEGAAVGRPMVASPVSLEGLPFRAGHELLLACEASEFAEAIVQLLENPARGEPLAAAARELVAREFSWQGHAAAMLAHLRALVQNSDP